MIVTGAGRFIAVFSMCLAVLFCSGCEAVGEGIGALSEIAVDAVGGIARVASGGVFESPHENAARMGVRIGLRGSSVGTMLEEFTAKGSARGVVSLDEVGRVVGRGQFI